MENETNIDLKPRERKFCEEYLRLGKKEAAAIAAGYAEKSARNAATKLMKKEECLAYIRAIQKRAREELNIDDNWAVLKAIDVYNRCMQAEPVMKWDYDSHEMVETGDYIFDSKGAMKALEFLRTMLGLGADDTDKLKLAITFVDDLRDDNNAGGKEKP